jgi:hypothetical protein
LGVGSSRANLSYSLYDPFLYRCPKCVCNNNYGRLLIKYQRKRAKEDDLGQVSAIKREF